VAEFEVADRYPGEEQAPWREYLVPAAVVNAHGPFRAHEGHDQEAADA
jgi:hypothetical protein